MKQSSLFLTGILSMMLVFVFALAGCASTSGTSKQVKSFEDAMARNDLSEMETILQKNAKNMDLDECMSGVVGRFINGFSPDNTIPALRLLLKYGANVNGTYPINNILGNSPYNCPHLMTAMVKDQPEEVLQFLIQNGANPNALARNFESPSDIYVPILWFAARWGDLEQVKFLVQNGAHIDEQNFVKQSPLFQAAINNYVDIAQFLVESGANVNLRDNNGATAASFAYDNGYIDIYNYLKEHGAVDFAPIARAPAQSAPTPSSSSSSAPSASTAPSRPSTSSAATLNTGYYGMSGADTIRMQLFSGGTVSVSEYVNGNWSVNSQGSYSIAGSNVIFSFTSGTLAGQRHQYTITGNKSFSGGGETWTAYY